jgi:hypothetical protein
MNVNMVGVSGGTFPIIYEGSDVFTTDQMGIFDIEIWFTNEGSTNHVILVDSDGTSYCDNTDSGFNVIFGSCKIIPGMTIIVSLEGGSC